jgi:DNA modification methylase
VFLDLQIEIEFWKVERLIAYAKNARTHSARQITQIAHSIATFGFTNPVLADPSGSIIAGHGRVLAARKLKLEEVPVIVLHHLNEDQKKAFRIADNKLALNAGWDEEALKLELNALAAQNFNLDSIGFDERELKDLLLGSAAVSNLDPDDAPEPEPEPVSVPGDIWTLGDHRLLCGDGTNVEELHRVLAGRTCDMVFTDLPYNVNYAGKTARKLRLANDNLGDGFEDFLKAACRALLEVSAGPFYICMSSSELHRLYEAFSGAGGHWSTFIVWAKSLFTLGRSDYQRQYEPILYGWRQGSPHYWSGARDQGDVWRIDKPRVNDLHPTMKPVELIERAIGNSGRKGNVVLDPFAGSGSTAIACENLGRHACLVELDPRYADVIVRRWEGYTGRLAELEEDGRSFEQVQQERAVKRAA